MTEKEKLMELLDNIVGFPATVLLSEAADYLIESGVRIPVRCDDCKHEDDDVMCPIYSWWMEDKDSFFCAFGERRADNG